MRVLQVLGSSAGGVARHVGQVASVLAEDGHVVRVAGPATVAPVVRAALGGSAPGGTAGGLVETVEVEIADRPQLGDVAAVRRLRALARESDVVHAHGLRAGALVVLGVRGPRRAPRARSQDGRTAGRSPSRSGSARSGSPRVVVTLHNLPVGGRAVRAVSAVLERIVGRGADVVLGVSPDLVALARSRGARTADLALVPAPAAGTRASAGTRETRAGLGIDPSTPIVVTVARLAPQKGLDVLIDAAARCVEPMAWLLVGGGPLAEELAARAEGTPVRLLGARDDVPDLLGAADVVVSAAHWEGQPLWLQEALAAGCAIVATDAGGTAAVTGDAALLVPVGDAAALGAAVDHLLGDADERSSRRAAALRRAAQLPRRADLAAQLAAVYGGPDA